MSNLLRINGDAKTVKGVKYGYLTGILYLAPENLSGFNTCQHASQGCKAACLNTAGRGKMTSVQIARIRKTRMFFTDKETFFSELIKSINMLIRKAKRDNLKPCVRLNGTSDIPWHKVTYKGKNIMETFPTIQFYDYTKSANRMLETLPSNYSLTFSRSESNQSEVNRLLSLGKNVAYVFNKLPKEYDGKTVIDGDKSDLRFTDKKGVIVGLKSKGDGKKDNSGFVIQID